MQPLLGSELGLCGGEEGGQGEREEKEGGEKGEREGEGGREGVREGRKKEEGEEKGKEEDKGKLERKGHLKQAADQVLDSTLATLTSRSTLQYLGSKQPAVSSYV